MHLQWTTRDFGDAARFGLSVAFPDVLLGRPSRDISMAVNYHFSN